MKKMLMMVVVAAFTMAANAQTPCQTENCDKNKTVACDVQAEPCCDLTDCKCPEGTKACGTECKPCDTKNETCKTNCNAHKHHNSENCNAEKAKACHASKKHCKSACSK